MSTSYYYIAAGFLFTATVEIETSDLEFEKKVGEGQTGTVYKGRWKSRGLDVAIKTTGALKKTEVSIMQLVNSYYLRYMYLDYFPNTIGRVPELTGSPKHHLVLRSGNEDAQFLHCYW